VLEQFMVDGWPDRQRFNRVIGEVLERAGQDGRKVRAFGEMVRDLCRERGLPLLCAYSKACFPPSRADALADVCREHTRILPRRTAA
jgi:hypothetical protein